MPSFRNPLSSRYLYLLISLITYFISSAMLIGDDFGTLILSILFSLIILFCLKIAIKDKRVLVITILLGIFSLVGNWYIDFVDPTKSACFIHCLVNIVFLAIITISVIYSVTKHIEITADTLFGAICAYLLLGFTWTFIYLTILSVHPLAFSDHSANIKFINRVQEFIYYSFATITTTGFGDILPVSSDARVWSWLEALTGQIYLAVWISQLVGLHIVQKVRK